MRDEAVDSDLPRRQKLGGAVVIHPQRFADVVAADQELALDLAGVEGQGLAVVEAYQVNGAVVLHHLQGVLERLESGRSTDTVDHHVCPSSVGQASDLGDGIYLTGADGHV